MQTTIRFCDAARAKAAAHRVPAQEVESPPWALGASQVPAPPPPPPRSPGPQERTQALQTLQSLPLQPQQAQDLSCRRLMSQILGLTQGPQALAPGPPTPPSQQPLRSIGSNCTLLHSQAADPGGQGEYLHLSGRCAGVLWALTVTHLPKPTQIATAPYLEHKARPVGDQRPPRHLLPPQPAHQPASLGPQSQGCGTREAPARNLQPHSIRSLPGRDTPKPAPACPLLLDTSGPPGGCPV